VRDEVQLVTVEAVQERHEVGAMERGYALGFEVTPRSPDCRAWILVGKDAASPRLLELFDDGDPHGARVLAGEREKQARPIC
jgi:hypothetical protein